MSASLKKKKKRTISSTEKSIKKLFRNKKLATKKKLPFDMRVYILKDCCQIIKGFNVFCIFFLPSTVLRTNKFIIDLYEYEHKI